MRKLLLVSCLLFACGKKSGGGSNEAPPPKPYTGAPVAFIPTAVKPGADHKGEVDVKAYNFSDKTVAQYAVMLRYHDASGAVLKVKPGTPFEKDFDFWSFAGRSYKCDPKSWCEFKIDSLDVPDKAVKAEVLAARVTALADDTKFEDKALFEISMMDWPAEPGAAKPADTAKPAEPAKPDDTAKPAEPEAKPAEPAKP